MDVHVDPVGTAARSLGDLRTWSRFHYWTAVTVCLAPLTVVWCLGVAAAGSFMAGALQGSLKRNALLEGLTSELGMALLLLVPLATSLAGVTALWSVVLPRALHAPDRRQLLRWQLLGLRLGTLTAVLGALFLLPAGGSFNWGSVAFIVLIFSSVTLASLIVRESGSWLLLPGLKAR